jgi:hypothetical protein
MNRNRAAAAGAILLTLVAMFALRAGVAGSQTATSHETHGGAAAASGKAATATPDVSKAMVPKPAGEGRVALPGVPPGKLVIGNGVATTITGEVMDPACFLEAGAKSVSKGHYQCAIDCIRSGQTLAIYDRDIDRIYFIAGELPGQNPNAPLLPYIHQKVDVVGTVYHRSQAWGIVIVKVTPHKPAAGATPASAPAAGAK